MLGTLDTDALWSPIAGPVTELQTKVDDASALADRASLAVRLLPAMLGGDGPRHYLFLFQNNAEIRATGGIPGAFALMKADDGKLTLGRQSDSTGIGRLEQPVLEADQAGARPLGPGAGHLPPGRELHPRLPADRRARVGDVDQAVRRQARRGRLGGPGRPVLPARGDRAGAHGGRPDAVGGQRGGAAAEQGLRRGAGPGPAERLLQRRRAQRLQGACPPARGSRVRCSTGWSRPPPSTGCWSGPPTRTSRSCSSRRHWRRRSVGGPASVPEVGVYLNASLPYKMDYYLEHEVSVESTSCDAGRQRMVVTLTMRSVAPKSPAGLSTYVAPEVPMFGRGTLLDTVYFFAPDGGYVRSTAVDGEDRDFTEGEARRPPGGADHGEHQAGGAPDAEGGDGRRARADRGPVAAGDAGRPDERDGRGRARRAAAERRPGSSLNPNSSETVGRSLIECLHVDLGRIRRLAGPAGERGRATRSPTSATCCGRPRPPRSCWRPTRRSSGSGRSRPRCS